MTERKLITDIDIVRTIELHKLRPAKTQVRPDTGDVSDLVESFKNGRQLHNIVVRHVPGEDAYEIICGHRRVEAARQCGWPVIDAYIIEAEDLVAEMYALEENLHRKLQPDSATAIARLYAIYREVWPNNYGGDRRSEAFKAERSSARGDNLNPMAAVAEVIGKSEETARRYVKVGSRGIPELKDAQASGEIRLTDAARIAGLSPDEQRRAVEELVDGADASDPTEDNSRTLLAAADLVAKAAALLDGLGSSGGMIETEASQAVWEAREKFNEALGVIWDRTTQQLSDEFQAAA